MKKAKWICYPGDFDFSLHNRVMVQRFERESIIPQFWRTDTFFQTVCFTRDFELAEDDTFFVEANGKYNLQVDTPVYIHNTGGKLNVPKGKHTIRITVHNRSDVPALRLSGRELITDESWYVSDASWHISCKDDHVVPVAAFCENPRDFHLEQKQIFPVSTRECDGKILLDYGFETMAVVKIRGMKGKTVVYFGESEEEALDFDACETLFHFNENAEESSTGYPRAFRYLAFDKNAFPEEVEVFEEMLPVSYRSSFKCEDERLNKIYEVALRTLHLNTREFFIDGIKRDRWTWGGDAFQSYLMNYYSFFELDVLKRTTRTLVGKSPITADVNQVMDYSFYWLLGLKDYYLYTADIEFIREMYPLACELIDYSISRTNENGLMGGDHPDDWVYVDWADVNNIGEVCVEQMLFVSSLKIMSEFTELLGQPDRGYKQRYEKLKPVLEKFWDEKKQAYIYSYKNGKSDGVVTKHPNIFAIMLNLCDEKRKSQIAENVMKNPKVPAIVTPYMRFYELAAMCDIGEHEYVLNEIRSYWGAMLDDGATSFWELYNPKERGVEKYAMYGRPYGKSLCHAWGASPVYLIGKYFIGLKVLDIGYRRYEVNPKIELIGNFEATLPMADGDLTISNQNGVLKIWSTSKGKGQLCLDGQYSFTGAEFDGQCTYADILPNQENVYVIGVKC